MRASSWGLLSAKFEVWQALIFDDLSLHPFTRSNVSWCTAEAGVGAGRVVQALMAVLVVAVFDERLELSLEVTNDGQGQCQLHAC